MDDGMTMVNIKQTVNYKTILLQNNQFCPYTTPTFNVKYKLRNKCISF